MASPDNPNLPITPESNEKIKNQIDITYRENRLFDKFVPILAAELKKQGYSVLMQTFPAGTPEQKIEENLSELVRDQDKIFNDLLESHANLLKENNIDPTKERPINIRKFFSDKLGLGIRNITFDLHITDQTVKNSIDRLGTRARNQFNFREITLDQFFKEVLNEYFSRKSTKDSKERFFAKFTKPETGGKEWTPAQKEKYFEYLGNLYENILGLIPQEKREKMKVIILTGLMRDFPSLIAHEPLSPVTLGGKLDSEETYKKLCKEATEFAEKMRGWMEKSGIKNIQIYNTGAEIPEQELSDLQDGNTYLVYDRHTYTEEKRRMLNDEGQEKMRYFWGKNFEHTKIIDKQASLQTPAETFFHDAQTKMLINIDGNEISDIIRQKLKKLQKESPEYWEAHENA